MANARKTMVLSAALFAAISVFSTLTCGGAEKKYDIFILGGQSNMAGRGTLTDDNRVSTERVLKFLPRPIQEEST